MFKNNKIFTVLASLMLFSVLLSACQALGTDLPEEDAVATSAAQTMLAITQTEGAGSEEEPTPIDDEGYYEFYDLASNYCDAGWETSVEDSISCPTEEDLENGFVQMVDKPQLEDGNTYDEPAILAYPAVGRSGYVVGRYYNVNIEEGDLFRAYIGCQYTAQECNVRYTLRVGVEGEGLTTIGQWREIYDGKVYPIDIDLSEYAGMEIDLVLSVIAQDDSQENYAMWLRPRILRESD